MMKPRSNRVMVEQANTSRNKAETSTNGSNVSQRNPAQLLNQQPNNAQTIRKRRSSINVYDQPSSLNSRLRQLETDMLRLDEDRTKLFDDTHSALTQYELKLGEIHAILKSRQDSVEKYVEDMKMLLQAKEEFERQTKLLNEKNERIHEKFMHRETTISREIKLLKNKFELLEKNRQFRSILQKSSNTSQSSANANATGGGDNSDDLASGLDSNDFSRTRSEATSEADSFSNDKSRRMSSSRQQHQQQSSSGSKKTKNVRIKLSKLGTLSQLFSPLFRMGSRRPVRMRRKSNKISSISSSLTDNNNNNNNDNDNTDNVNHISTDHSLATNNDRLADTSLLEQQKQLEDLDGSGAKQASDGNTGEVLPQAPTSNDQEAPQASGAKKGGLFGRLFR